MGSTDAWRGMVLKALLVWLCTACGVTESIPPGLACNALVFSSERAGDPDIYVFRGDELERLTDDPAHDVNPRWSPDGSRIVFASDRDGDFDLYVLEGDELLNLTANDTLDSSADWSPDGGMLVFDAEDEEGVVQIYTALFADPTEWTQLTHEHPNAKPVWSPDGKTVAFLSLRDGNQEIYVMAPDGGEPTNLTNHPGGDVLPAWSPDGSRLAYSSERNGNWDIYVMGSDGSGVRRITDHSARESNPTWSADGAHITFTSNRFGVHQIFSIRTDGTELSLITDGFVHDCSG